MTNYEKYVITADYHLQNNKVVLYMREGWKGDWDRGSFLKEWLLCEYKGPKHKLTQFEHDLLSVYPASGLAFEDCAMLMSLREKGHFKSINTEKTIKEILENCEVISDV